MNDYALHWNADTGRCHGVSKRLKCAGAIRITEIPKGVTLPEVCMLVEKRPDIRQRGFGIYAELLKRNALKKRHAG